MNMQDYTTPFAINGDRDEFSIDTDPSGNVSLERGWTEPYQLRPEEGGKFIPRRIFNQMMKLISTDTVTWKTQTFPNWIADKGDGTPYAYPKDMIVKYTDGNIYLSKVDNNISIPTDTTNWSLYSFDINSLTNKATPVDTDVIKIQESGGLFKKLRWANLKATLFDGAISPTPNGYIKFPTVMGGLIIQWGTTDYGSGYSFPLTFPNSVFTMIGSQALNAGFNPDRWLAPYIIDNSSYGIASNITSPATAHWVAIGY